MYLRISEKQINELNLHFKKAEPHEEGAFLLIGACPNSKDGYDLTVRSILLPHDDEWDQKGEDFLHPSTSYINRAVVAADHVHCGLAFVHSHPSSFHPHGLSYIDIESTARLFANLETILPGAPLASLVVSESGWAGSIKFGGTESELRGLRIIGGRLRISQADSDGSQREFKADSSKDRQILAFGQEGQDRISRSRVGVVGAGGTGSAVCEQLARLGVTQIWVIDDDKLEISNISRVYGSTPGNVKAKTCKVDVVSRHYKSIQPGAKVTAIAEAFPTNRLEKLLSTMDIVFCCTDTNASRAALNDLAYRCHVPVIDIGCLMKVNGGQLEQSLCRIRVLQPDLPCLWCTDTIDGRRILQESLSPDERKKLADEGYGLNVGPQPSLIHLTTLAASLAVNEFLRIIAWAGQPNDGTEIIVDLESGTMMKASSNIQQGCRCIKVLGLGLEVKGT